jgi:hypothetical protein
MGMSTDNTDSIDAVIARILAYHVVDSTDTLIGTVKQAWFIGVNTASM